MEEDRGVRGCVPGLGKAQCRLWGVGELAFQVSSFILRLQVAQRHCSDKGQSVGDRWPTGQASVASPEWESVYVRIWEALSLE